MKKILVKISVQVIILLKLISILLTPSVAQTVNP